MLLTDHAGVTAAQADVRQQDGRWLRFDDASVMTVLPAEGAGSQPGGVPAILPAPQLRPPRSIIVHRRLQPVGWCDLSADQYRVRLLCRSDIISNKDCSR